MPVTIYPASHRANIVPDNAVPLDASARTILEKVCADEDFGNCAGILQSSLEYNLPPKLAPASNGFAYAAIRAYHNHHHLVIRPDDIWLAILTQFNFHVNSFPEEFRSRFVEHKGQSELLEWCDDLVLPGFEFKKLAKRISQLFEERVIDRSLREWITPAFTTTLEHDVLVASIIMMGTTQNYFSYAGEVKCGLPSVTLLGEKADYELITRRLAELSTFGPESSKFCKLLRPILRHFIMSFDEPTSTETIQFWQNICKMNHNGSGPNYLTGSITAFLFWTSEGEQLTLMREDLKDDSSPPEECLRVRLVDNESSSTVLQIDGVTYPMLLGYFKSGRRGIPHGYCKLPFIVRDLIEFKTELIAGSFGIALTSSGFKTAEGLVGLDTMQPHTGWWISMLKWGS